MRRRQNIMDGILVIGSINLDLVARAERIPGPGENVCGATFSTVMGGKGANQAVASRRLGADTLILGRVGSDPFAGTLLDGLGSEGVDVSLVGRGAEASGTALIVVEEGTGANTIVVAPGANSTLQVGDLDALNDRYGDFRCALFQLEIPVGVVREGSRRARDSGLITILDAGPPRNTDHSLFEHFDVVSPNQHELEAFTGVRVTGVGGAVKASRTLIDEGVPLVVAKMGSDGAVVVSREGAFHCGPYRVDAVDTTAAGDAFTAALAVAMAERRELEYAVKFACAAGALAVTVFGAQPSMPERRSVLDLMSTGEAICSTL